MEVYHRPPNEVIAYTAGVIDGEGSITRPGASGITVQLSQAEKNRGEQLCRWFRDQWQIGTVLRNERTTNLGIHSIMWVWQVSARRDCLWLLRLIQPYLIVKGERAAALIPHLETLIDEQQRWTVWTANEDEYLRHHRDENPEQLAAVLQRTCGAILSRRRLLGLVMPGGKQWRREVDGWTEEEDRLVSELYSTIATKELAERLGRSHAAINRRARMLGQAKGRGWRKTIWNDETDGILRANYRSMSYAKLGELLGVPGNQVKLRAHKLGLIKKPRKR